MAWTAEVSGPPLLIRAGTLADPIEEAAFRFADAGGVGVLVVDAGRLADLERARGPRAFEEARSALVGSVQRFVKTYMRSGDLVLADEAAEDTVVVLFFRTPAEASFFTDTLPTLPSSLQVYLAGAGSARLAFGSEHDPSYFAAGQSLALYRNSVRGTRQITEAIARARQDAQLSADVRDRERRQAFLSLLLGGRLRSVYQPIVDLQTGDTHGFEALIRGVPNTDFRYPTALFAMAHRTHLSFELDCLCRRIAMAGANGGAPGNAKLFLNCLPSAMNDPSFSQNKLGETLDRVGLQPQDIVLEISESESIRDISAFYAVRDYYRSVGIKFALDDTGAGYASLQTVMQVEPDYIKVDAALIRSIDSDIARQALVRALNALAMDTNAVVIAEGVETLAELNAIRAIGVPLGQGFFLGKPGPLSR